MVMPRFDSRESWWWSKATVLLIVTVVYTLAGAVLIILSSLPLTGWSGQISNRMINGELWPVTQMSIEQLLLWTLLPFGTTLLAVVSVQTSLSVVWQDSTLALGAVAFLLVASWFIGNTSPELVRWLPGSQSMLMRHTLFESRVHNYSISWSVAYNLVLTFVALEWGAYRIRQMDIK